MGSELRVNRLTELRTVLDTITIDRASRFHWDWKLRSRPGRGPNAEHGYWVWAEFQRIDIDTGVWGTGEGRREFIAAGATVSAVVKTAWGCVQQIVQHELMHAFLYAGKPLFDPHASVARLHSISNLDKEVDSYALKG